jgi:hypothetical protein
MSATVALAALEGCTPARSRPRSAQSSNVRVRLRIVYSSRPTKYSCAGCPGVVASAESVQYSSTTPGTEAL